MSSNFLTQKKRRWESWTGQKRQYLRPLRLDLATDGVIGTDMKGHFHRHLIRGPWSLWGAKNHIMLKMVISQAAEVESPWEDTSIVALDSPIRHPWDQQDNFYGEHTLDVKKTRWRHGLVSFGVLGDPWSLSTLCGSLNSVVLGAITKNLLFLAHKDQKAIKGGSSHCSFSIGFQILKCQ